MSVPTGNLYSSWVEEIVRELQTLNSELHDVEAKRARTNLPSEIYRTLSAFGNREGGGILLLGVDEQSQFKVTGVHDVAKAQHDLFNYVQNEMSYPLRLEPTVETIDSAPVVAVKVMEAPFQQKPVYYKKLGMDKGSFRRSNTSNAHMTPEEIRQLLVAQIEMRDDFTARLISTLPDDWYDPLEMERLRQILRAERSGSELDTLPDRELLVKLQLSEPSGKREVPTIAGLLLVGKEQYIRQHVTEHEVIFLRHPRESEEYENRSDLKRPLLAILDTVSSTLETTNRIVPVQMGLFRFEIPRLNPRVYREAVLNAVIHRNYGDYGSVMIREYPGRLLVTNPGGFLPGIGPNNILSGGPKHRNRRLAEAFQLLGLVERAGMGVPKMYRYQLETGKQPPSFSGTENRVEVSIPSGEIDERMASFVASHYRAGYKFDVPELIVIDSLRRVRETRASEVARMTQQTTSATSLLLHSMVSKDLLRRRGGGPSTSYVYSPTVRRSLESPTDTARDLLIESIRCPELIIEFVRQRGKITNADCRELCHLNAWQASRLLRRLAGEGVIVRRGASARGYHYVLPTAADALE